jgi:crotonobetainyl-CoA:carnitine CoA-transferase CaiB-like acyl-CoA transferase
MTEAIPHGLLSGLRVLEIGHFVATAFCARPLADLDAVMIKIAPPGGDPVRQRGKQLNGHPLWWVLHARNKRSVILNLKHPKAAAIVLRLVAGCDARVENFRPEQFDRLGLDEKAPKRAQPDLVVAHISGFGQDGPYRDRAAFGVITEAIGGVRYLSDRPPGVSIACLNGACTLGFALSWIGIYLVKLLTSAVRATAASFVFNGARLIAWIFPIVAGMIVSTLRELPTLP